ncbi:MAG: hypothetical protein KDA58_06705 [Planctomycetaceae bacterium]|nr:hypothetical protein [Planctomycetaceae bacterium]
MSDTEHMTSRQSQDALAALAIRLRQDACQLAQDGRPPAEELLAHLESFLAQEEALAAEVAAAQAREHAAAEARVQEMAQAAEAAKLLREEQTLLVLETLEQLQKIESVEPLPTLRHEQQQATELEALLPFDADHAQEDQFQQLLSGSHRWNHLLKLVTQGSDLSDSEWDQLSRDLRASYDTPLANAALRGKLSLGGHSAVRPGCDLESSRPAAEESPTSPPEAADQTPQSSTGDTAPITEPTSDELSARASEDGNAPSKALPVKPVFSFGSVFDEMTGGGDDALAPNSRGDSVAPVAKEASSPADALHNALFDDEEDEEDADSAILRRQHRFTDPTGVSAELATEIHAADLFQRGELLPELILSLIFEGRSGLAYHLAKCLEAQHQPAHRYFPSWAIRAWTLGNAVLFPTGQLAGRLQEDLAHFHPEEGHEPTTETELAHSLFVRAAALRPAIVAPSSGAARILRTSVITPETTQLFNYCLRIGSYGEKLQGLVPNSFKRGESRASIEQPLQRLKDDVRAWLNESASQSVRYTPATPLFMRAHWSLRTSSTRRYPGEVQLWNQWQDTLQSAQRIITNILTDDDSRVSETRQEMDRLATLTSTNYQLPPLGPSAEMRTYLLQSITFAQRWTTLRNQSRPVDFVPAEVEELRSEIEQRHDSVTAELEVLAARHSSSQVQTAIGCLMLAMDQLRDLVDPDVPADTQEPDARHLMHSELLKIPNLQFAPNWSPDTDAEDLLEQIVRYLAAPNPDWLTAVQLQLAQSHLDAAEKLTTLPVWSRPEQQQLQQVLARYRKEHRDELWKDLQETETLIDEAVKLQIFSEQDRAGFAARLERLRRGLSLSRGSSSDAEEIQQLRQAVERRRSREATLTRERLEQLQSGVSSPKQGWKMDF